MWEPFRPAILDAPPADSDAEIRDLEALKML